VRRQRQGRQIVGRGSGAAAGVRLTAGLADEQGPALGRLRGQPPQRAFVENGRLVEGQSVFGAGSRLEREVAGADEVLRAGEVMGQRLEILRRRPHEAGGQR
jgi:hypothetical protein